MAHWIWGLGLAGAIAGVAYRARALSRSGAVAAWVVGTVFFACGGWWATGVLLAFFLPSSLLSALGRNRKAPLILEYAKGNARDWGQVLANGGAAAGVLLAMGKGLIPREWGCLFVTGALAAATADTWATEVGGLALTPRLITTGRRVPRGTSGAISGLGVTASLLGGMWIGGVSALLLRWSPFGGNSLCRGDVLWWVAGLAGLSASLVDSWLGATVQRVYWCPHCEKETERQIHRCGTPTLPLRGWSWCSNDVVNFIATLVGGIMAVTLGG